MRRSILCAAIPVALSLVAGCGGPVATATPLPAHTPPPPAALVPTVTPDASACPPADGEGTVHPDITIYSVCFVVNGLEQVVRDGDTLQASPGDTVRVREVTVCSGTFSGSGGEACVEFAPLDQNGREVVSAGSGTHMRPVTPGLASIPGPDHTWTIGEDWGQIVAVLNHWPPGGAGDPSCGGGKCEHDDRIIVGLDDSSR